MYVNCDTHIHLSYDYTLNLVHMHTLLLLGIAITQAWRVDSFNPHPPVPSPDKPSPAGAQPFTCLSSNVAAQPINYFYYQFMS